ncbi:MAG: diguanylate cyclase [Desulfovibrionaceae bacterium]
MRNTCTTELSAEGLLDIIDVQTEIVKLGPDFSGIINLVARQAQEITGASGAIVELAEDDDMVYRAATGIASGQLGLRLKRESSLSGLCIATGEVLHCQDSDTDERVDREACRRVGLRSMIVAPLLFHDAAVGVLKVASSVPRFFTQDHLCTLKLMSELIAAAMYHSARHEISELYHRATHDMLTGLANRALFYDRLRQHLAQLRRKPAPLGLLMLDMDGLKTINDTYGHRAGDAAIREMAQRARTAARKEDTVARLGGDEFAVILPDVQGRDLLHLAAERITGEVCRPFAFEEQELPLGVSVGGALFPEDAENLDALIESADKRMYAVKRERKGDGAR